MKCLITCSLALMVLNFSAYAQDTATNTNDTVVSSTAATTEFTGMKAQQSSSPEKQYGYQSPYKTSWKTDGAITLGGIGLTYLGTVLIANKKDFTQAEILAKNKDQIPFFDRGNAGYYSEKADRDSYIPFQISFGVPVVFALASKNERNNAFQVLSLYVETMAITGTLFTMATGNVYRSRPYVYGDIATMERKMENDSHRSFYAGHTAATAAATFFAAKVFQDFHPNSSFKPYVWVMAASVPALVGYLRYKAGMHFLSDNVLGYALGAGAGLLVPQLHKIDKKNRLTFVPQYGKDYKGFAFTYKF